jgi:hypothetical protein
MACGASRTTSIMSGIEVKVFSTITAATFSVMKHRMASVNEGQGRHSVV